MKDVRDALMIGQRTDGTTVRRPLSPHLQVYKPQLTSVLSIANRLSGIASSIGTLMLVWWLVASAGSAGGFASMQGFMGSFIGVVLLFGWTVALMYHFFGGLRHLAWDAGYGFDLPQVYASGYAVLIATAVSTVLIWAGGAGGLALMADTNMNGANPKVEVMRSYLGRARGMGAAKSGVHHWQIERITAIALVPLTVWFIYAVLHLLGSPQAGVHRFVASPVNTVLLIALVAMTFHHMQLGLQVVMEDYIHEQKWQTTAILLNKAVALLLGLLCIVSILRMAFTA